MMTIRFPRLRSLVLGAAFLGSFFAAAHAAELLFKDEFQFLPSEKTLDDINSDARSRQSGPLAPATYSSNGASWQCKSNTGTSGSGSLRLFPSGNHLPLVLSPAWTLSKESGDYSLSLQIRPQSWTGSQAPEKLLVAIGAAPLGGLAGVPPDLAGAIVVEITIDRSNGTRFLSVLLGESALSPPIELVDMADLLRFHDITLRWAQSGPGQIERLSVGVNGATVFNLPKARVALRNGSVLFGGQVRPGEATQGPFADMSVRGIRYAREGAAQSNAATPGGRAERPLIGAIRWDGWGNNCEVGRDSERVLGPAKYQHRAPFFVAEAGEDFIRFKPLSQEIMDEEIGYALHAGIDYWAFDWYPPGKGMELARDLFLASEKRERLKWCVVLGTNPFDMDRDAPWLAAEFAKPGYQKVLDGRPLVYLFTQIRRADLDRLRALSLESCGKTPYVAMMGWTAQKTAQACDAMGADAVSMYAGGTEQNWNEYAALKELIPNVSTGWDPSPFKDTHVAWYPPENVAKEFTAWSVTPGQLVDSVSAAFTWLRANPGKAPANTLLIYAWNEHSEGGWLCPTYTPRGPNTERVDALHDWTSRQRAAASEG